MVDIAMDSGTSARLVLLVLVSLVSAACHEPPGDRETDPPAVSTGSERMAERLALFAETTRPMRDQFANRERLELMGQMLPEPEAPGRLQADFRLARERLLAGESSQAALELTRILERLENGAPPWKPNLERHLRSLLAAAHLRVGEQQNCLHAHGSEACLFPIAEGGQHVDTAGSRAAMVELERLLRVNPEDLESRWLYNLAAMTVGSYPSDVPEEWLLPPALFESEANIGRFRDIAPRVGLDSVGLAGGSVTEDFDGDGYLDILSSSWGLRDPLTLMRNRGDGTFEDVSEAAGLTGLTGGLNLIHADYDNDGDADVLVLRGAWRGPAGLIPNSLLENRSSEGGRPAFVDVTEQAGLLSFAPTLSASWADFDQDGRIDLFVGHESLPGQRHPCQLYRNEGPGEDGLVTFSEVSSQLGLEVLGYVKGVTWGDFDNDGAPDLYVSRLLKPNLLFHNRGDHFHEMAQLAGVAEPLHGFATWFFDYDHDGWLDLFVAAYASSYSEARATQVAADYLGRPTTAETPRLYRNRGDGTFEDVSAETGIDRVSLTMGANFGDLDNDGWLDFYLGTGAPDYRALTPNLMFRNDEGRGFQEITTSGGFGHLQKGHGISFADLDNDGDQDVYAVMGGAYSGDVYQNVLFENPGHGHRWITLRLEGTSSNRAAIGARLHLELETAGGRRSLHRVVSSGGSFGASSLQQEIGLKDAIGIRRLEIRWPGAEVQVLRDLPLDSIVQIRQGADEIQVVEPLSFSFDGASETPAQHHH